MKVLTLAAVLLLSACNQPVELYTGPEKQFICMDEATVVERHAGVATAGKQGYGDGATWRITYVDSDIEAYYEQPAGETCYVEVVE